MTESKKNKFFNVENNFVFIKEDATITLLKNDYKNLETEFGTTFNIEEFDKVYEIPGFFEIEFNVGETIRFSFPYLVYLNINLKVQNEKDRIILTYKKDDAVFYANFKSTDTDIMILNSLYETGARYLANEPGKLLTAIWKQLSSATDSRLVNTEIILSNLYVDYDKKAQEYLPLRLTGKEYSKEYVVNSKKSSHLLNNSMGFLFGYSKESIVTSVSQKKRKENSFFENILIGDFNAMEKQRQEGEEKE